MHLCDEGVFLNSTEQAVYRHIERRALEQGGLTARYSAQAIAESEGIRERRVQQILQSFRRTGLIERVGNGIARVNLPHNQARRDLSGVNLAGANLYGVDFHGTNLSGANLTGTNLVGADLTGANLEGADLEGADWSESDAMGANLAGANLARSRAYGATMHQVNLEAATLKGFKRNSMLDHRHGTLGCRIGHNVHDWICIANDPPTIANLLRRQLHGIPEHVMVLSRILSIDGIVIGCWIHGLSQICAFFPRAMKAWAQRWHEGSDTDIYSRIQFFHQIEILRHLMADDEEALEKYFDRMATIAPTDEWRIFFRWHKRENGGKLGNLISPDQMLSMVGSYSPFSFECDFRSETLPLGRPKLPTNHLATIDRTLSRLVRPDLLTMGQWMRQAAGLSDIELGVQSKIERIEEHPAVKEHSVTVVA